VAWLPSQAVAVLLNRVSPTLWLAAVAYYVGLALVMRPFQRTLERMERRMEQQAPRTESLAQSVEKLAQSVQLTLALVALLVVAAAALGGTQLLRS
jgi:predicted histidine transporter YuiF (NhaC family)